MQNKSLQLTVFNITYLSKWFRPEISMKFFYIYILLCQQFAICYYTENVQVLRSLSFGIALVCS